MTNLFTARMAKLGYHPTTEYVVATRNLFFVQNGTFDGFDSLAAKCQNVIADFEKKYTVAMADHTRLVQAAKESRQNSINEAARVLGEAMGNKVDTKDLRNAAKIMMQAVNFFKVLNWLPIARKALTTLLNFAGIKDDVITKMQMAAQSKIDEADRLENEAAQALQTAIDNDQKAQTKIEETFKREMAKAEPKLAAATDFKKLAESFQATLKLITAK